MTREETFIAALRAQTEQRPEAVALVASGRSWTFARLLEDAERAAGGLKSHGCKRGDRVVVFAHNHWAAVLTWLAGARTGIAVSIVNSRWTASELSFVLEQLAPRALVTDADHAAVARQAAARMREGPQLFSVDPDSDGLSPWYSLLEADHAAGSDPATSDIAEITYTSGTATTPKGAVFSNATLKFLLDAWNGFIGYTDEDIPYAIVPLFHASGLRYSVLAPLVLGCKVVLAQFSARRFWADVVDQGCTYFFGPEGIPLILETLTPTALEREHKLKHMLGGGKPEFADRVERRFGLVVLNTYGMTEFGPALSPEPEEVRADCRRRRHFLPGAMYIGRPIHPDIKVRIVDGDGVDVADGAEGEIWVSSPGMFERYFEEPDATALAVVDGWMRTGDLGCVSPEGRYYFIDRKKDVIRRGGENIASSEVEDWILSHPAVAGVAVFPVPDDLRVQEVKALIEPMPGQTVEPAEIWGWCSRGLGDFKIPRYLEFRTALPRNATGRALKRLLREEPLWGLGETWDRSTGERVPVPARR